MYDPVHQSMMYSMAVEKAAKEAQPRHMALAPPAGITETGSATCETD